MPVHTIIVPMGDIVKCCGSRFDQAATYRAFFLSVSLLHAISEPCSCQHQGEKLWGVEFVDRQIGDASLRLPRRILTDCVEARAA